MKKIGILTFHRAYNFGAVLQAYATQQAVRSISDELDVYIIDYRCDQIEKWFRFKSIRSKLLNIYWYCFHHSFYTEIKSKGKLFNTFSDKYLTISNKCVSWKDFYNSFDAIVVGSDQVWNLDMTQNDINYYLPYDDGAKKLTYAASFGKSDFSEEQTKIVQKYLLAFHSVLIREEAGVKFAERLGIKGRKVVDPTLLLDKQHWEGLCESCDIKKPFVLLYIVAKETYCISLALKIAQKEGWDIVFLDPSRHDVEGTIRMKTAGPGQFLWLIRNAKLVVTTSYHGLIFSLNMNTPFLYELAHVEGNTNSRLEEIATTYNLKDYAIESDDFELYEKAVYDWESINRVVADNRCASMSALKQSIEED